MIKIRYNKNEISMTTLTKRAVIPYIKKEIIWKEEKRKCHLMARERKKNNEYFRNYFY